MVTVRFPTLDNETTLAKLRLKLYRLGPERILRSVALAPSQVPLCSSSCHCKDVKIPRRTTAVSEMRNTRGVLGRIDQKLLLLTELLRLAIGDR